MYLSIKNIQIADDIVADYYARIVNDMPYAAGTLDKDGKIIMINPALELIMGYKRNEVIGHTILNFIHPGDYGNFKSEILAVLATGNASKNIEYRAKYADGEYYWQEISWVPHYNCDHKLYQVNFFARDINERKLSDTLLLVRNLTKEKEIEELKRTEERLESLGTLAGGIAHDFNNILTIILGYLELYADYPSEQGYSLIVDQVLRAEKIANQLMSYSKGGLPVKEDCSIKELIATVFSFHVHGSNIAINLEIAPDLWIAAVDQAQIGGVFDNLLKNAKEAMPSGGTIQIEAKNTYVKAKNNFNIVPGPYICIKVKDTGTGIPKEFIAKIFEPYQTTKKTGHGLGLYQAYNIIKKHNGLIWANSIPNQGTTFTIYLPANPEIAISSIINENATDIKMGKGQKILVMDDEEPILKIMKNYLKKSNYRFIGAENGNAAIVEFEKALLENDPFSAVILDLTIPGSSCGGRETLDKLKAIDHTIQAIVSSGYSDDPVISNYQKYGFANFLKKPFKLEELQNKLSEIMEFDDQNENNIQDNALVDFEI